MVVSFNKIRIKVQNKIINKGYRYIKGKRNLCFTQRKSPCEEVSLEDEDWQVNLKEKKAQTKKGL